MSSLEAASLERLWFSVKNNDSLYFFNKFLSFSISTVLAFFTLYLRSTVEDMNA